MFGTVVNIIDDDKFDNNKVRALQWMMSKMDDQFATSKKVAQDKEDTSVLERRLFSARKRVEDRWQERQEQEEIVGRFG